MTDKSYVNPTNGEFTQVYIDKGGLTDLQIDELILAYFLKKENALGRNLTGEEKTALSLIFHQAIKNGKSNPAIIFELMVPSTNRPFKQFTKNDKPLDIKFRKPARYEK